MTNEIKEINKNMQYIIIGNKKYYGIAPELLDYITNLQEELEEEKRIEQEKVKKEIDDLKADLVLIDNQILDTTDTKQIKELNSKRKKIQKIVDEKEASNE